MEKQTIRKRGRPKKLTLEQVKYNQYQNLMKFYMRNKYNTLEQDLKKIENKFKKYGYNIEIVVNKLSHISL